MKTYVIKSEIGFLSSTPVFNGKATWSQEYPDAIVWKSPGLPKRILLSLSLTAKLTNAHVISDYGLETEATVA